MTIFSKILVTILLHTGLATEKPITKHPFHVSTTEINANTKERNLEITTRIFTDDFETILAKKFKKKIDLKKNPQEMDLLIKTYLQQNLTITVNGKLEKLNYIGFENDYEATNVYLEITGITAAKVLQVNNTILFDLFNDQMNILHVTKGDQRKSLKTSYPESRLELTLK